ncbi:hypothetical protein C1646_772229 [Rhizophagus diaphanus]|nr:hypothetical protein C1646_772229 [Rhizophagus diaphanus] [Rhizophagus sp. MUCL 43196]
MDLDILRLLGSRYDHETPEMWCSHICDTFKKILKENLRILSGNGYITMYGKYIDSSNRIYGLPSNYIYCCICDSLVFIPETPRLETSYQDSHFKRCINREEKAKINHLHLEFFSQFTLHLEKDKLASISYNYDTYSISYEAYLSAKATIAENTISNTPNFKLTYISVTFSNQEMISPTSYQSLNCKSDTGSGAAAEVRPL